jgi:membrane protein YdbS with pleckstrin-like domain
MDATAFLAIMAFGVMFALFVIVPTLVKRKHQEVDIEPE